MKLSTLDQWILRPRSQDYIMSQDSCESRDLAHSEVSSRLKNPLQRTSDS
jgi:hypothetical protein